MKADVVVAGGGPAGLLAAETAAREGLDTLLLEREDEIGWPVHTSGGTAISAMEEFGIPSGLYHPVTRLRICGVAEEAAFDLPADLFCVIAVTDVYKFLADRAVEAGATIITGANVVGPVQEGKQTVGCEFKSKDAGLERVRSNLLVDATGYRASVSKAAGLHSGFTRFGVGAEYELIAPHCDPNEVVLVVGDRYAPKGYGWVFPWGKNRVRVGVGILHTDSTANPKEQLELFLADAAKFGVDLTGSSIAETHFGLIPSAGLAPHFVGDGVVAVGDAAGQASLVVGEGIRISMIAGRMVGNAAAAASRKGRWDASTLMVYERQFRKRFGTELKIGHIMNRRMMTWDDAGWDEKIAMARGLPTSLVADLLQSQFSVGHLTKFVLTHPQLWPRAMRYAIKGVVQYART